MKSAIFAGTFDPVTNGHVDLIRRALRLVERLTVAVASRPEKKVLFTQEERVAMIREAVPDEPRLSVEPFDGLLVQYAERRGLAARARELKAKGEKVVSFATGEPDFDTPAHIQEAAIEAIRGGHHHYTEVGGVAALRAAIAEKLRLDNGVTYAPKEIVVTNGAKHAIWNALFTLLEPGDEVLIPVPYWVTFPEIVRLTGGEPVFVEPPRGRYKVTAEALERAAGPRARALALNSRNNPSGAVYAPDEIAAIADVARRKDLMILSDEIYEQLVYGDARHVSAASLSDDARARTVLVNGVSKTWAMTGWRIGYAAAAPEIAEGMERLQGQSTSNASAVSQQAALKALTGDRKPAEEMKRHFAVRREFVVSGLSRMK